MNYRITSGLLGVIATASAVSYLGMNQGHLVPLALQGQVMSSAGSSASSAGACNGMECASGGNTFCASQGRQCIRLGTPPCFVCGIIDTFSSSTSSAGSPVPPTVTTDLHVNQTGPSVTQLFAGRQIPLAYNVQVRNGGTATANAVELIYPIQPNTTPINYSHTGCAVIGTNVLCKLGDMAAGAAVNIDFQFAIKPPVTCTDTAFQSKAFTWSTTVESDIANNASAILTRVICPPSDLSVTKTGPGTAKKGDTIVYQVVVKNTGAGAASNVTVRDTIPAGFTYVANLSSPFCVQNGSSIICTNGNLASQQQTAMSLAFLISPTTVCGAANNTVVTATTSVDSNTANNTANAVMTVTCPVNLTLRVDGPPSQSYAGNSIDAVLARLVVTPDQPIVLRRETYFVIQGIDQSNLGLANGTTQFTHIDQVLKNVELRNVSTGLVTSVVPFINPNSRVSNASKTYQVYKLYNDVAISSPTTWEFRADFIDNGSANHPKNGDQFRVHVCTEPSNITPSIGCTFGGLIVPETQVYNLQAALVSNGNAVNILPGGSIVGNFHKIASPTALNISVKSIGSTNTIVKNQKNVNLMRFEARANEADDILLTSAVFNAQAGSLLNAQNYALWVDTNGDAVVDTILEKGINSSNSEIIFQNLVGGGYVIPKLATVLFEVHADIAANLTGNTLQLKFYSEASSTYLQAETLSNGASLLGNQTNGSCNVPVPCQIIVTTTPSMIYTIANQGNLFITKSTTPIRSRQLLGGTLSDEVLRLTLRAEYEDIDAYELRISTWDTIGQSIDRLELYKPGSTSPFSIATIAGCGSQPVLTTHFGKPIRTFCANVAGGTAYHLVVPRGQNMDVIVRPRLKTDVDGAISGENVAFWLSGVPGDNSVQARGVQSSNTLLPNDGDALMEGEVFTGRINNAGPNADIAGNPNVVVLSKVVSIVNGAPATGAVPMGTAAIGEFKFTVAPNTNSKNGLNKTGLATVLFSVSAPNVSLKASDFVGYNKADASQVVLCYGLTPSGTAIPPSSNATGTFFVSCAFSGSPVNNITDPGASSTFVLRANIVNPQISATSPSSLQVSLKNFSNPAFTTFGTSTSNMTWHDQDAGNTSVFFWVESPDTVVNSTLYTR